MSSMDTASNRFKLQWGRKFIRFVMKEIFLFLKILKHCSRFPSLALIDYI